MNEFDRNPRYGAGDPPPVEPSTEPAKPVPLHHGMVARLRNYFLTGLVLVGPALHHRSASPGGSSTGSTIWCGRSFRWPTGRRPICRSSARLRPDHRVRRADAARLPDRQPGRPHAGRARRKHSQPHAGRAADLQEPEADLRDAVLQSRGSSFRRVAWSSFRRPACGRWCSCRSRRAPTSRRGCRRPSTSRPSCRARPIRPPASSSTCRAAT